MALPEMGADTSLRAALSACSNSHVSYLLGAGASTASGLPDWATLLTRLLGRRKFSDEAIGTLLRGQDNLLVAEAAFAPRTSAKRRAEAIYRALYATNDTGAARRDFSPSPLHLAVAGDAGRRGAGKTGLLTLNYDDLLEEALTAQLASPATTMTAVAAGVFPRAAAQPRAADRHAFEVHHLHGLLPRESRRAQGDELVLTLRDYNHVIDQAPSWQESELLQSVQRGPLLMVGTSFSDPDVRVWLHRIRKLSPQKRYLLLPRQSINLPPYLVAALEPIIVQQWAALEVECLLLDDYAETTQAILEMSHIDRPDYRPPRERVADVLGQRLLDLHAAQEKDFSTLAGQVDGVLSDIIGQPANLTLWLLNGDTELVRWATNDRVYRDEASLRRVNPRLESSWIVSQAVCYGDQRIQDISVHSRTPAHTERTGRWRSVSARPLTIELPGGPPVTVGALSSASIDTMDCIDTVAWSEAMNSLAREWERDLQPE